MSKPRTVYIGVETFGLLDFRGKTPICIDPSRAAGFLDALIEKYAGDLPKAEKPHKGQRAGTKSSMWPVDGDACALGDWYAVHEGMVDGPYKSEAMAEKNRRENFGDCTITDDPGRLWRVHKVHRVTTDGLVTHAILKAKVW